MYNPSSEAKPEAPEAIGFIGLGRMGTEMVRNIIKAGIPVTCFARNPQKSIEMLSAYGIAIHENILELASLPIIVSIVTDDKALEDVLFTSGLALAMRPGNIFISMSFNSPTYIAEVNTRLEALGLVFINATVFGRPEAAAAAKLLVCVAGNDQAVARCGPVFAAVGRKTLYVGTDPKTAAITKLVGNFLVATIIEGFSEAAVLSKKSGLASDTLIELVKELFPMGGLPFHNYIQRATGGHFDENVGATVAIGLKDVGMMRAQADAVACPLPLADIHHEHLRALRAQGREAWDWVGVAQVLAELAGTEL